MYNGEKQKHYLDAVLLWRSKNIGKGDLIFIIDGQQRITTILIFIKAVADFLHSNHLKQQYILNSYDVNTKDSTENFKISHSTNDSKEFEHFMNEKRDSKNKFYDIYKCFSLLIKKDFDQNLNEHDFLNILRRIYFTRIEIDADEDPQLIFEKINGSSLVLTTAEKIKNYLLMSINDEKKLEKYFNDYWKPIEQRLDKDLNVFINIYVMYKCLTNVNENQVYEKLKEVIKTNDQKTNALEELLFLCNYYQQAKGAEKCEFNSNITNIFWWIKQISLKTLLPLIFALLNDYKKEKISLVELEKIFTVILVFALRKKIINDSKNFNKMFTNIYKRVKDKYAYSNFLKGFKEILFSDKNMVNDKEIEDELRKNNVYKNNKQKLLIILLLIELKLFSKEKIVINEDIQIEHIMPQNIAKWKEEDEYLYNDEMHEKNVNKLGNMSLTGINQKLSNSKFSIKKEEIKIRGTRFHTLWEPVINSPKWTEDEINKRTDESVKIVLQQLSIDKYKIKNSEINSEKINRNISDNSIRKDEENLVNKTYKSDLKKVKNWNNKRLYNVIEREIGTIKTSNADEDFDISENLTFKKFTSCKIVQVDILEKKYKVDSMIQAIMTILKYLHDNYYNVLDNESNLNKYLSKDSDLVLRPEKILGTNIYFGSEYNNNEKMRRVRIIAEKCNVYLTQIKLKGYREK
ncbi:DUF262 domain-containing protein [Mycoplasmopsis alligatoris]|uniref:GmrSD restriction endonucleases N-terminal domain-containing protein n=1 Tax=Mycoplasmopsis alligatoris A21JP2 TaxID=747682 RepID=D4XV52_9BACT|nr:conserved hypothetical protein [Mycoplasmopsis alligatoris A21JP2]